MRGQLTLRGANLVGRSLSHSYEHAIAMDPSLPASAVQTSTLGPSPVSPHKRQLSQGVDPPSTDVLHAGKRLREALLDDAQVDLGVGGSGEKGKAQADTVDAGSLSLRLESQVRLVPASVFRRGPF